MTVFRYAISTKKSRPDLFLIQFMPNCECTISGEPLSKLIMRLEKCGYRLSMTLTLDT